MLEHSSGISCGLTHKNKISELSRHSSSPTAVWPLSFNQFRFASKMSYPDIWYSEFFSRPDMSDFARWPQPMNPIFFNLILVSLFVYHYFYLNFFPSSVSMSIISFTSTSTSSKDLMISISLRFSAMSEPSSID